MKIIDLLNKIANGEVPKKIKVNNKFTYIYDGIDYKNDRGTYLFETYIETTTEDMNIKVEILDDEDEEKGLPEKIDTSDGISVANCAYKINEIIDYLKTKQMR